MLFGEGVFQRGLRCSAIGLTTVLALIALSPDAHAKRFHRAKSADSYQPAYSSIVVDANSGAVMQATNADDPRHPASLTKIMTLYLLFERLEQGKIKLTSDLPVSARAAVQAPSKLGLKPGDEVTVEFEPVRNGRPLGRMVSVILPDGKKLTMDGVPGAPQSQPQQ